MTAGPLLYCLLECTMADLDIVEGHRICLVKVWEGYTVVVTVQIYVHKVASYGRSDYSLRLVGPNGPLGTKKVTTDKREIKPQRELPF